MNNDHKNSKEPEPYPFSPIELLKQAQANPNNISLLFDIPVKLTVVLGRTTLTVRDVMELTRGSLIQLDRLAGEPVDIMMNGVAIAKGEVVVIDNVFSVRIVELLVKK